MNAIEAEVADDLELPAQRVVQRTGQHGALTGEFEFSVARGAQGFGAGQVRFGNGDACFGGVFVAVHKVFGAFEQRGSDFDAICTSPKRLIT